MSDLFDELGANQELSRRQRRARAGGKRRQARGYVLIATLIAIIVAAGVVFVPQFLKDSAVVEDYTGQGTESVSVVIPQGATGTEIANILVKEGVIATAKPFIDAYNADARAQSDISPGTYRLKKKMSASAALASLMDDSSKDEVKVTIPEGFTKQQVYERLAAQLDVPVSDVEAAAADATAIGLPSEAGGNPEGWFAPLTYTFASDTTPSEALATMVEARVSQLEALSVPREQWQAVLIKASIIEREAGLTADYSKVARVIENRLVPGNEVNGYLQMDSTVLYGIGKTGGSPNQDQLNDASNAYNTYQHAGLPPSPIGAASTATIEAVLNPAEGAWLYFVTVNLDTGETKFATTLDEHNTYVAEYRAWIAEHPQATSNG